MKYALYGAGGLVVGIGVGEIVGEAFSTPEGVNSHYGTKIHMLRHERGLGTFLSPSTTIMDVQAKFYPGGDDMNVYGAVCDTCGHVNVIDLNSPKSLADGESRFAWVLYQDVYAANGRDYCDYWKDHHKMVTTEDGRRIPAFDDCVNNYICREEKKD